MHRFCYLPDKQKRLMAGLMNFFVAMTKESHPCHVIIAASDAFFIKQVYVDSKLPKTSKFMKLDLEEIASSDLADYIRKRFEQEESGVPNEAIKGIIGKPRCHPYYIQLLCGFIHRIIAGKKKSIETGDIEDGYEEAFISEKTYFEKLWEELTVGQLETWFRIISSESLYSNETKTNVGRSVWSLLFKGIIRLIGRGKYGVIDPFFEGFLRRNR